jgi:hypothetical protein
VSCFDGNSCTADTCDPAAGCTHPPVVILATCGVGACLRTMDLCASGVLRPCEQGSPAPEVCNGIDDDCDGLVDDPGASLCPSDSNPCTQDVCGGTSGCNYPAVPDGTPCNGGSPCSVCQSGTCSGAAPMTISVFLSPSLLRPTNHKMVNVTASVSATSSCPGSPAIVLTSIASSEQDDAPGPSDGHTVNDIQGAELGTADFSFQLRAEADRNGPGRFYTVVYTATDSSGRQVVGSASILAPVKGGGGRPPSLLEETPGRKPKPR